MPDPFQPTALIQNTFVSKGVAAGSYVGDGNNTKAITGIGFLPVFVIVYDTNGAWLYCGKTDVPFAYAAYVSGGEQYYEQGDLVSLDPDGFTVGNTGQLSFNENGENYSYVAFADTSVVYPVAIGNGAGGAYYQAQFNNLGALGGIPCMTWGASIGSVGNNFLQIDGTTTTVGGNPVQILISLLANGSGDLYGEQNTPFRINAKSDVSCTFCCYDNDAGIIGSACDPSGNAYSTNDPAMSLNWGVRSYTNKTGTIQLYSPNFSNTQMTIFIGTDGVTNTLNSANVIMVSNFNILHPLNQAISTQLASGSPSANTIATLPSVSATLIGTVNSGVGVNLNTSSTQVATFTPSASGLYKISWVLSCVTTSVPTLNLTWYDALNGTHTITLYGTSMPSGSETSGDYCVYAAASHAITISGTDSVALGDIYASAVIEKIG